MAAPVEALGSITQQKSKYKIKKQLIALLTPEFGRPETHILHFLGLGFVAARNEAHIQEKR